MCPCALLGLGRSNGQGREYTAPWYVDGGREQASRKSNAPGQGLLGKPDAIWRLLFIRLGPIGKVDHSRGFDSGQSREPCVYRAYFLEEKRRARRNSRRKISSYIRSVDIMRGPGSAALSSPKPVKATITLPKDHHVHYYYYSPSPPSITDIVWFVPG